MYDVNAHLAATDTPNNFFTRTAVRVMYPPVKLGVRLYFGFGVMFGSERISLQFTDMMNEQIALTK